MDHVDLTPNEIASILGATDYPEADLPGFQQSFRELYHGFAKLLQTDLTVLIDRDISVEWTASGRLTYGEFMLSAHQRQSLCRADTEPNFGPIFLQIAPSFVGDLVNYMLGGHDTTAVDQKNSDNEIENRLSETLWHQLITSFCKLWATFLPVQPTALHHDADLKLLRLLPARQYLSILEYSVTLDGTTATVTWCFADDWPVRAVQQAVAPYCPTLIHGSESSDSGEHELIAELATTHLSADDVKGLKVGDILQTDKDVSETLDVRVDGVTMFRANLGKVGQQKAVQIRDVLSSRGLDEDELGREEQISDPTTDAIADAQADDE